MADTTMRPLGAQISRMLKSRGVDTIFGIPGVHNIELYRGIEEAGITHILARHEQGAGFMADGYARATGRPGVAYVITGPGLTNIMTPMGQAYSDSVPMLVISSCLDETAATRGQLHQMRDQRAAAAAVCDWSEEARTAEAAYTLIDRALSDETRRKRPVHIQIPIDLLSTVAERAPERYVETHSASVQRIDESVLSDFAQQLEFASKPLFIFGGGFASGNPTPRPREDAARELMRRTGAAAFTTYAAAGLLASEDPLSFGCYLGRPDSKRILAEADLVIAIGTELSECDLWRDELGHEGTLVRVDIDPEVLADRHRADMTFASDAYHFAAELIVSFLPDETAVPKWDATLVAEAKARFRAEVDAERPNIAPICDALRACLPETTMIYSDMTQFAYVAKEVWDMPHPGLWHHPTGFGTLGYALPAAIGGAVARRQFLENATIFAVPDPETGEMPVPDLPTIAIAGDYGFQYTMQELGTAVELGLPLPILLWDNGKLKEIEDSMTAAQIAPNAVTARNPDFLKLAEAYGARATEPASLEELQRDVLTALKADRPTLIRMTPALA